MSEQSQQRQWVVTRTQRVEVSADTAQEALSVGMSYMDGPGAGEVTDASANLVRGDVPPLPIGAGYAPQQDPDGNDWPWPM